MLLRSTIDVDPNCRKLLSYKEKNLLMIKQRLIKIGKLMGIGMVSGSLLAFFLKLIQLLTANRAYHLLFDVSYIPLLKKLKPVWLSGGIFHFGTCMGSIIVLYEVLSLFRMEKSIFSYLIVIGTGSAILFILTFFANDTPGITDFSAWIYWVLGHLLFALVTAILIQKYI